MRSARWMSLGTRESAPRSVKARTAFCFPCEAAQSSGVQSGDGHHWFSCDPQEAYALKGRSMALGSRSRMSATRSARSKLIASKMSTSASSMRFAVAVCPANAAQLAGVPQYFPSRVRGLAPRFRSTAAASLLP
jgi:hypothetical protein